MSWMVKNFAEVVFLQEGPGIRKHEYQEDGYPMINVRCVQDGFIDMTKSRSANMDLATSKWKHFQIDEGDILFTISGTIGRAAIVKKSDLPLLMNTSVVRFKSISDDLDRDFLFHYVSSSLFVDKLKGMSTGTAIQNVGPSHLKKMTVPIPPLREQKQIVSIFDKAFAAIDQAKTNIEKNIQNAEELFQSKLNEVFSQKGEGWEEKKLNEITSKIGSGATPRGGKSSYKSEGIPLVRSLNVYDEGFKYENLAFIDDEQAGRLDNVELYDGDVLLNITGASVARCCVLPQDCISGRVNQHVSIIRVDQNILNPHFLQLLLTSQETKNRLLAIGEQGSTRQAITKAQIESFTISYPKKIDVQIGIVENMEEMRLLVSNLKASYHESISNLNELKASILQKAFNGDLTSSNKIMDKVETAV